MYCRICGTHRTVNYRRGPRMNLCDHCASETPRKASRQGFDKAYWRGEDCCVPESIKKEFYNDYKSSTCTVSEYIEQTSTWLY